MLMFLSTSNLSYTTHFNVMTYRSALHTLAYYIVSYQEDGGKQQRATAQLVITPVLTQSTIQTPTDHCHCRDCRVGFISWLSVSIYSGSPRNRSTTRGEARLHYIRLNIFTDYRISRRTVYCS